MPSLRVHPGEDVSCDAADNTRDRSLEKYIAKVKKGRRPVCCLKLPVTDRSAAPYLTKRMLWECQQTWRIMSVSV
ncbi:hypothetical protein L596_018927 [Steinernema carpocapsae]|uniref:Uncharacterized protein n=1 Tax=Steinernema carpocapsae TaxID=34508 RepID=A0A4U5N6B7_STECR|nr:hypothetical protein L596_018927 [Steinernema carpocapsae]